MGYLTSANLSDRLGPDKMVAIFDDNGDGTPDASPIALVIQLASARVDVYLARNFKGPFPLLPDGGGNYPEAVTAAAVEWARYLAFDRHPEYVRTDGAKAKADAEMASELLSHSLPFLAKIDASTETGLQSSFVLSNQARVTIDSIDGTYNGGDF